MLYCTNCGESADDHAKFCNKCGTKLASKNQDIKQTQRVYSSKSQQKYQPDIAGNKLVDVVCEDCGKQSTRRTGLPGWLMVALMLFAIIFAAFTAGGSFAPLIGMLIGWKLFHSKECKECGGKLVDL